METDGMIWKMMCYRCSKRTKHTLLHILRGYEVIAYRETDAKNRGARPYVQQIWLIYQCNGCDALFLEDGVTFDQDFGSDPFDVIEFDHEVSQYHPAPEARNISIKRFERIPDKLRTIYQQTHSAYVHELDILCAVGLRSLIEGICDDKEISGKRDNLEKKIKNLAKLGIPANMIENLHGFRFMGNTAVHELTAPDGDDLRLALEIIEDILNFLYDLNYKLTLLGDRQRQNPKFIVSDEDVNSAEAE